MEKTLRFNYRLTPPPEHELALVDFGAYARGLWNLLLSENIRRYNYNKTFLFYKEMASLIKERKAFPEFQWIKNFDAAAAQQVARDLDTALRKAFSKTDRQCFPKHKVTFREKKLHNDSFRIVNNSNCIKIEKGCVSIPKIGKVPIILHRKLVSAIKTATVKYLHGKWYISFTQVVQGNTAKTLLKSIVGYDINSNQTVVGSDGFTADNPKFLKKTKRKMNILQRQLARRTKGSGRWKKTKQRLNALHGKISRQRLNFAHNVAKQIANASDIVVFEDLNVKGMQQFNGKMVSDNVMGLITQLTKYKTELNGNLYHEINRFTKSTGICMACGQHHLLTLNQRTFTCTKCHFTQSRDGAASKSIERTGESELIAAGIVARGIPHGSAETTVKTKAFVRTKFVRGSEKNKAA